MPSVTVEFLESFAAAWNRHDVDALMEHMTDDCVFQTAGGAESSGTRHSGRDAVRRAYSSIWQAFPDAQWRNGRHFVSGDRGVSEWTFVGTALDGSRIEADGVDLLTFRDGRIQLKNAFRKDRPRLPARG
jgi:ketosteroid isomerase-like protein